MLCYKLLVLFPSQQANPPVIVHAAREGTPGGALDEDQQGAFDPGLPELMETAFEIHSQMC